MWNSRVVIRITEADAVQQRGFYLCRKYLVEIRIELVGRNLRVPFGCAYHLDTGAVNTLAEFVQHVDANWPRNHGRSPSAKTAPLV